MASLQYYNPPAAGARFAAYRPVVFEVVDNYSTFGTASNIPVVYLDIYINGSYYKTLSATSSRQQIFYGGFYSAYYRPVWTFDLQDAMQEYLRSEPAVLSSTTFDTAAASICTFSPSFAVARSAPLALQCRMDRYRCKATLMRRL